MRAIQAGSDSTRCSISVFTHTKQDCSRCSAWTDTYWSSNRLLGSSPPLPKKMNPLAEFQVSTTSRSLSR